MPHTKESILLRSAVVIFEGLPVLSYKNPETTKQQQRGTKKKSSVPPSNDHPEIGSSTFDIPPERDFLLPNHQISKVLTRYAWYNYLDLYCLPVGILGALSIM